ncbi:MAG: histidine kinase N-terminal 7TM domain-containing protein [Candidatus Omnitrophica bacterium]|nr:histidine kinase N-terminal 7TM domain-containing protein [Candidatus Omnitrophota bacterium]
MDLASFLYIIPHIISAIIFLLIIIYLNPKMKDAKVKYFLALMANCFLLSIFKMLELIFPSESMTYFFSIAYFSFLVLLPFIMVLFVIKYLGGKCERKFYHLIYPNIFFIFLMITNMHHHLYFSQTAFFPVQSSLSTMAIERGIFGIISIFYNYAIIAYACIILLAKLFNKNFIFKSQAAMILIGIIAPFLSNIIFSFKLFNLNLQSDMTMFSFTITAFSFFLAISKYRLLNLSPLARNEIFDELQDALIIINEKDEIVDFNKNAKEIAKKLKINDLFQGKSAKELIKNTEISLKNDSEFSLSNGSKLYYNSSIKKMMVNENQVGIILSIKDVTKIKEYESLKAKIQKEKEISQLRDNFITRVSHELRHPLMNILGYSNELKDSLKSGNSKKMAERIIESSNDLKDLVEKSIALSGIKSKDRVNMGKKNLSIVINNCLEDDRINKEIISDCEALINESQMIQAVNNLLDNALKYSKGKVELTLDCTKDNAVISVADKGKGIDEKTLKELHSDNYLAKVDAEELKKGFGIGIAVSRMIIKAHNGKMSIESKKGKGTKIKIILEKK